MPELFRATSATSLVSYTQAIERTRRGRVLWFRGQNNAAWRLLPSLARIKVKRGADWLAKEEMLIRRFRQDALTLTTAPPDTAWGWLLLMQHHGVPTRLLDWSENPLAALYFATVSMSGRDTSRTDGCVWCLDPAALNDNEAEIGDIPCMDVDDVLATYLPANVAVTPSPRPPVAALALRSFPRLVAQQGVFTLVHKDRVPLESVRRGAYVGRILIPRTEKAAIRRQLANAGVNRLALFPELESLGTIVRELA